MREEVEKDLKPTPKNAYGVCLAGTDDQVSEALAFSFAEGGENVQYTRHNKKDIWMEADAERHRQVMKEHPEVSDPAVYLWEKKAAQTHEATLDEYLDRRRQERLNESLRLFRLRQSDFSR